MSMEVRVQLVHADGQVRVVHVSAYAGEQLLGSALGEAPDAEAAEDRALQRLMARLAAAPPPEAAGGSAVAATPVEGPAANAAAAPLATPTPRSGALTALEPRDNQREKTAHPPLPAVPTPSKAEIHSPPAAATFATAMESSSRHQRPEEAAKAPTELPAQHPVEVPESSAAPPPEPAAEPPADPEDWSSELQHLDRELQRLQWGRAEEEVYLQRAFGHPSRNRLTSYADLLAYLRAIEALGSPADPATAAVPMRRQDLLSQCDALLRQLGWPRERARQFLESQLQVSSRQQLSDQDLLQFNLLLEGELLAVGA
jgi:hypothetical protein